MPFVYGCIDLRIEESEIYCSAAIDLLESRTKSMVPREREWAAALGLVIYGCIDLEQRIVKSIAELQ